MVSDLLYISGIIQERIGDEMEDLIRWAHRYEWYMVIVKNLETLRKKDKGFDAKMAMLFYYNEDIEEMKRRWNTLIRTVANNAVAYCNKLAFTPWPESWHPRDEFICLTKEEYESVVANWPIAKAAIKDIPLRHLERRRLEAPSYWKQQRDLWQQDFDKKLAYLKKMNDEFGAKPLERPVAI
jgi:hypothetical protein